MSPEAYTKNFPGCCSRSALATCFEGEAKEPETAGFRGKEYEGCFRGEERGSEELISTNSSPSSGMLRFLAILVASHCRCRMVEKQPS